MNILSLVGRDSELFRSDIDNTESVVREIVAHSSFLVIGGTGSIGQSVVREFFGITFKNLPDHRLPN
jgi:FlaA1/EpsC-like NDP-sugar epimerase